MHASSVFGGNFIMRQDNDAKHTAKDFFKGIYLF